jgi:hypothetical protein
MKVFLLISFSFFCLFVRAQAVKADKVPAEVKNAFAKAHPGVNASWEKEDGNFEAEYKQDGKTMSSVMDKSGEVLETETDIPASELPAEAKRYLSEHFKNAKVKEASRVVKANGEVSFEARVNKQDVVFDANGKFIKLEK